MNGGITNLVQGGGERREARLSAEAAGWRLDRALAAAIPTLSRERLKALVSAGVVEVDGRQERDPARKMKGGEAVCVAVPEARPAEAQGQDIPIHIVFEDEHLLVVDKPAGLVVHPAAGNLDGTLVNALLHHCAGRLSGIGGVARPGIVHRIDKDTSGLLVVAKTDRAHAGLAAQFQKHTIGRRYKAVVSGIPTPPAGRIETNLARSEANRQKIAVVNPPRGRHAITHFKVLQPFAKAALVECRLETGRTHQVRVHMAHIGHPLVGDPAYGQGRHAELCRKLNFHRQALHAAHLEFEHPISREILAFESPTPHDIQELLIALGQI
jgi:23S rRNA pseudouridine1911/1915/1917 synthase